MMVLVQELVSWAAHLFRGSIGIGASSRIRESDVEQTSEQDDHLSSSSQIVLPAAD